MLIWKDEISKFHDSHLEHFRIQPVIFTQSLWIWSSKKNVCILYTQRIYKLDFKKSQLIWIDFWLFLIFHFFKLKVDLEFDEISKFHDSHLEHFRIQPVISTQSLWIWSSKKIVCILYIQRIYKLDFKKSQLIWIGFWIFLIFHVFNWKLIWNSMKFPNFTILTLNIFEYNQWFSPKVCESDHQKKCVHFVHTAHL
jgi:hypothetical protein